LESFVAKQVDDYRTGKISRRKLIETLTLAAAAYAGAAKAASADPALKVALVNHVSYTCPDFKRAVDWYSKLFNLDQVGATDHDVALPFGRKGEQPYGVSAADVPLPHLIIRTRDSVRRGEAPRRNSTARVNHIAYTIADFDKDRVRAELKRLGYANPLADGEHSFHIVDPNGFDVQISGIAMTALSG
jgi:catechol 2,3-dioxygenase-like lactoylglutathione lyase family enzyme